MKVTHHLTTPSTLLPKSVHIAVLTVVMTIIAAIDLVQLHRAGYTTETVSMELLPINYQLGV